jgi:hypothetical protein
MNVILPADLAEFAVSPDAPREVPSPAEHKIVVSFGAGLLLRLSASRSIALELTHVSGANMGNV